MKEIKYRVLIAHANETGRDYIFVRTDGMDYGMFTTADCERKFFEGSIENFVPSDVMKYAKKASLEDITKWFDAICEEDIHGELQVMLMNILELKKFDKKGRLMLFNDATNQTYSCWNLWRCSDEQLTHKMRYTISEICSEGFNVERLKNLKKIVDKIDFLKGSPRCDWYLRKIDESGYAVIKAREDDNEFYIRLFITKLAA